MIGIMLVLFIPFLPRILMWYGVRHLTTVSTGKRPTL